MNITRTACSKTSHCGATFLVATPAGFVDVQMIETRKGREGPRMYVYIFTMVLEGWRYEAEIKRPKKLTRTGKSRIGARLARECWMMSDPSTGGLDRTFGWYFDP